MNIYVGKDAEKKSDTRKKIINTSAPYENNKKTVGPCFDPLVLYLSTAFKYKDMASCKNMCHTENFAIVSFFNSLHLVIQTAKTYQRRGCGLLGLIEMGTIGLLEASENFEEARDCPFSVYATWWIRQAIVKGLAENRQEHMIAQTSFITREVIYRIVHADISDKIIENVFSLVLYELVNKILLQLHIKKNELQLNFGINGRCPLTLYEKNEVLNCVHTSIQHILEKGYLKSCEWCDFKPIKLYA